MFEQPQSITGRDERAAPPARSGVRIVVSLAAGGALTIGLAWLAFESRPLLQRFDSSHHTAVQAVLDFAPLLLGVLAHLLKVPGPAPAAAIGVTLVGGVLSCVSWNPVPAALGGVVAGYLLLAVKVADQWEKAVVLRFGRYRELRGPGLFHIIPMVDRVGALVDQRVRTTAVHAEAALTRDTVPVNVDAVIFWVVWDVEKAILEVQDFDRAVALIAQTALLESIGRHDLGQMIAERGSLGRDLRRILEEKTTPWGITLQSVEIRDLKLPRTLEDALSRQAQAERERQARVTLGTAEAEIAGKFAEASTAYKDDPVALQLRAMNMLYEAIKEKGTMVVVPTSGLRRRPSRGRGRA